MRDELGKIAPRDLLTDLDEDEFRFPRQSWALVCRQREENVMIHSEGIVGSEDGAVILPVGQYEDGQGGDLRLTELNLLQYHLPDQCCHEL